MAEAIEHPKLAMADTMICPTLKFRWLNHCDGRILQQQFSIVDFNDPKKTRVEWRDVPVEDEDAVAAAD